MEPQPGYSKPVKEINLLVLGKNLIDMKAITQLRNTKRVKRLIYISCSPASAVKNFVDLSRASSKMLRGAPFTPVRAVSVDMFPHTKHVELAILFERENENPSSQEENVNTNTEDNVIEEAINETNEQKLQADADVIMDNVDP